MKVGDVGRRAEIEIGEEWYKWAEEIPYLQFPPEWRIKIVPPMVGAIVRFWVQLSGTKSEHRVSVYLDCYNKLGFYGGPYWEVYPVDADTYRCGINETKELLDAIARGLKK